MSIPTQSGILSILTKFFFFFWVDQILPLLPDLKLTVCSAGTWLRRWPWQCCPLVRCDLLSRCFRGTVRRERSLSTEGPEHLYSEMHRDTRVSVRNPTTYSKLWSEETHQLAEKRWWAYIRGLGIPGENHRIWTLNVAPEHVPFLDRQHRDGCSFQLKQVAVRHAEAQKDGALTSILPLRSLKMEEMIVSSSVSWTCSLDGQISRRYTSFPSEVTPTTHTRQSWIQSSQILTSLLECVWTKAWVIKC